MPPMAPSALSSCPLIPVIRTLTVTIGCIGTDHTRASLALRERLAVAGDYLDTLADALRAEHLIAEVAVLSTCNRTEIYVAAPDVPAALEWATQHLLAVTGVPAGEV